MFPGRNHQKITNSLKLQTNLESMCYLEQGVKTLFRVTKGGVNIGGGKWWG